MAPLGAFGRYKRGSWPYYERSNVRYEQNKGHRQLLNTFATKTPWRLHGAKATVCRSQEGFVRGRVEVLYENHWGTDLLAC